MEDWPKMSREVEISIARNRRSRSDRKMRAKMDGWLDGLVDGWIDGWKDSY